MTITLIPTADPELSVRDYGSVELPEDHTYEAPFGHQGVHTRMFPLNLRKSFAWSAVAMAVLVVVVILSTKGQPSSSVESNPVIEKLAFQDDSLHYGCFIEVGTHATRVSLYSWPKSASRSTADDVNTDIQHLQTTEHDHGLLSFLDHSKEEDKKKGEEEEKESKKPPAGPINTEQIRKSTRDFLDPILKQAKNFSEQIKNAKNRYGGVGASAKSWGKQAPEIKDAVMEGVHDALKNAGFTVIRSTTALGASASPTWLETLLTQRRSTHSSSHHPSVATPKAAPITSTVPASSSPPSAASNPRPQQHSAQASFKTVLPSFATRTSATDTNKEDQWGQFQKHAKEAAEDVKGEAKEKGQQLAHTWDNAQKDFKQKGEQIQAEWNHGSSSGKMVKASAHGEQPEQPQQPYQQYQQGGQQPQGGSSYQQYQQGGPSGGGSSPPSASNSNSNSNSIPEGVIPAGVIPRGVVPKNVIPQHSRPSTSGNNSPSSKKEEKKAAEEEKKSKSSEKSAHKGEEKHHASEEKEKHKKK